MTNLADHLRTVRDFPRKGILFYDISPLLDDPVAFREAVDSLCARCEANGFSRGVTKICAVEARGFLFAPAMAYRMGWGVVPIRKPGKLPWKTIHETYDLEYGSSELHVHADAIGNEDTVLLFDDLLATGGTAAAMARLVRRLGGRIAGVQFLAELTFLNGRKMLRDCPVDSLIRIDE
ncbi:MAG: adenine phosphoribosyltransferase [Desulfovibrio sp.]|jgi:adenine phosphoribosyltransferase|nr:adenine phosphoribosyltransferase [Desulfovibrio sp.]